MKSHILFLALIAALVVTGESKPLKNSKEPVLELPTFVVIGTHIPSSWLEVAWECRGPLPINRIKRAWISRVASDSPAAHAGFKVGDALLAMGETRVETMTGYSLEENLRREREPGATETFSIQTPGQKERTVVIVFEGK